ncbi:MAG: hypothetical protein HZB26_25605 [Candidatus Hydrogenedentes bacterium]|nr:hypothetical protein [Candidatus Hydrogenedentota bacterium]
MVEPRIRIGSVYSVNAARRQVRVDPVPAYQSAYAAMKWIRIAPSGGPELRCKVETAKVSGGAVILSLSPGIARDTVAQMKGAAVVALSGEVKARQTSLKAEDVLGMTIVEEQGQVLGSISEAYTGGANDAIEVRRPDDTTFLLPLIEELVARVDWEQGKVVVRDITPYVVTDED